MIVKEITKTPGVYPLHDVRVIDGDAIEADIILPFGQKLRARIRLKGWWADELSGPYAAAGLAAKVKLATFCADNALWLHSPSERKDRYGRIIGSLISNRRIVIAGEVLGHLQLTEKEHKARRDEQRRTEAPRPGLPYQKIVGHGGPGYPDP